MTLFHRYFSNCSCFASFTSQLVSFKKTFLLNNCPISFSDKCIQSFLNKIHSPAPKVSLAPKKIIYFFLPFTAQHSLQIRTQISKLCFGTFPHIKLRFVFVPLYVWLIFPPLRTGFPRVWNPMWFIVLSVYRVVRCISAKPAVFSTPVFQTTWAYQPLLGKSALTPPPQVFCYRKGTGTRDTRFLHVTLIFYLPLLTA